MSSPRPRPEIHPIPAPLVSVSGTNRALRSATPRSFRRPPSPTLAPIDQVDFSWWFIDFSQQHGARQFVAATFTAHSVCPSACLITTLQPYHWSLCVGFTSNTPHIAMSHTADAHDQNRLIAPSIHNTATNHWHQPPLIAGPVVTAMNPLAYGCSFSIQSTILATFRWNGSIHLPCSHRPNPLPTSPY
jgi:hypothetical protein